MLPRILSIASPLAVYLTLGLLAWALYRERKRWEWAAMVPAGIALIASFLFIEPEHLLYFDEDIYIHIASNLAHAPVSQITMLGAPDKIEVATYYKQPSGFPVLLSLVFLLTGTSETAAFLLARLIYACTVAIIYLLAKAVLPQRKQAVMAAVIFAALPVLFWGSASIGTDLPAVLFSALGVMGICLANGPLAAAGIAMAAQTRLELGVLICLLFFAKQIEFKWKIAGAALILVEVLQVAWVVSVAPILAQAAGLESAFSPRLVPQNAFESIKYLLNPFTFPVLLLAAATFAWFKAERTKPWWPLAAWCVASIAVYPAVDSGRFDVNPRYSIQMYGPVAVMAAAVISGPVGYGLAVASLTLPHFQAMDSGDYILALRADHRIAANLAKTLGAGDLVVAAEPEVFLNHGIAAMSLALAADREQTLRAQMERYERVWYYAGTGTAVERSPHWAGDRWMKSRFELHSIESHEIGGKRISFYQLLKPGKGQAR